MAIELNIGEIVMSKDDANGFFPLQLSGLFSDGQELSQSLLRRHCWELSMNCNGRCIYFKGALQTAPIPALLTIVDEFLFERDENWFLVHNLGRKYVEI